MGRRSKPRNRTRVFVVQDASGSMNSRRDATVSGFNEYVDELETNGEGNILLSLIQFDSSVNSVYTSKDIHDVPRMENSDFVPGGLTALYDGVGTALKQAELSAGENDKVLIVIMTDGGENSSRDHSQTDILSKIKNSRKKNWEFVFMGAGEEAWNAGAQLGIAQENTLNYGVDAGTHLRAFRGAAHTHALYSSANIGDGVTAAFDPQLKKAIENDSPDADLLLASNK